MGKYYFKYLYVNGKEERNKTNTLECVYDNIESLEDKFIVQNGKTFIYTLYDKMEEYVDEFYGDKKIKYYHEVIFGHQNQKLKFDLDISKEQLGVYKDIKIVDVLSNIITNIQDLFYITYLIELVRDDILLTTSNREDKYSYHIIINNYAVENNEEAKLFTKKLFNIIKYKEFLDVSVNKSTQLFRLLGNCKEKGLDTLKKEVNDHEMCSNLYIYEDTIITNTNGCSLLPKRANIKKQLENEHLIIDSNNLQTILDMAKDYSSGLQYYESKGNMIIFRRIHPSYCLICKRIHDHENSLILNVVYEQGKGKIYAVCRRNQGQSNYVGEFEHLTTMSNKKLEKIIDTDKKTEKIQGTLLEKIKNKTVYNEEKMRPFEQVDTLYVSAQMKMGKTKNLIEYIKKYHSNKLLGIKESKIIFISFRKTFSSNIKEKFPDFTLYSDVKGDLNQKKLIIQGESLYRIPITAGYEAPDLLILDESESIFDQFNSGLFKRFQHCFETFRWLLKNSSSVIAMDAYMTDRTYRMISRIRMPKAVYYHKNEYKNAIHDIYDFTYDKVTWLQSLCNEIDTGEKIVIPTNSLEEATILYELLTTKYPDKEIKCYSSKTSEEEKREHFNNVNEYWQYDILIYTPTVSAGVSFEKEHYDKLYGYFTDQSCGVETCIQMMGRIRNIKSKTYVICLSVKPSHLPATIADIKLSLSECRDSLFKDYDMDWLHFEYTRDGIIEFKENDYFQLYIENKLIKNLSRNNFTERMISYIKDTGATIKILPNTEEISDDMVQEYIGSKQEIKEYKADQIAKSKELTEEEIEMIETKKINQEKLSINELNAYEKYKLRKTYNHKEITKEFVMQYNKKNIKYIYKNLCRINAEKDIDEALKRIQEEEKESYKYFQELEQTSEYLYHIQIFDKHRIAIALLKLSGFETLTDNKTVTLEEMTKRFKENENLLKENIFKVLKISNFKHYTTNYNYIKKILSQINIILAEIYGIRIIRKSKEIYCLSKNKLFTINDGIVHVSY